MENLFVRNLKSYQIIVEMVNAINWSNVMMVMLTMGMDVVINA